MWRIIAHVDKIGLPIVKEEIQITGFRDYFFRPSLREFGRLPAASDKKASRLLLFFISFPAAMIVLPGFIFCGRHRGREMMLPRGFGERRKRAIGLESVI